MKLDIAKITYKPDLLDDHGRPQAGRINVWIAGNSTKPLVSLAVVLRDGFEWLAPLEN